MAYKNDIGRKLKIAKYSRTSRTYELKHEVNDEIKCIQKLKSCVFKKPINSLNIMSIHQIENYIQNNYINVDSFEEEDLVNDLTMFKTYKDNQEMNLRLDEFALSCFAVVTAIVAVMTTVRLSFSKLYLNIYNFGKYMFGNINSDKDTGIVIKNSSYILSVFYFALVYYFIKWRVEAAPTTKLKTVNNAIHILEVLKDEMVEENKIPDTRDFEVNVDSLIGEKPEHRKYSVKVREILEDKSK